MKTLTAKATDFLQNFPLFNELSEEELMQLTAMVKLEKYKKFEDIYKVGDPSTTIFFLVKGMMKLSTQSDDGREVIKHILHPMAMFGELGVVGEKRRKENAIAIDRDVQIYSLKVIHLRRLIQSNHDLLMKLLALIGNRLRHVEDRLESLIFKDARERIIDFLKQSATKQGKMVGYETLIKHSLTQQDIANITGTSRQTVTSVLNDLRKANLIYFNRRSILIRDLAKLA